MKINKAPASPLGTAGKFAALKEKLAQPQKTKDTDGISNIIGRRTLGRNKTSRVATDGTPGF